MSIGRRASACIILLALLAACAAPPSPSPLPATATPNGVQTALALLTASFASLTPTAGQTLEPSQTPRGLTATSTPTVNQTLRVLTLTASPPPSQTLMVSTLTPAPPIVPGNALSLTQAAVLAQAVLSGTAPARLDQVAWAPDTCPNCGAGAGGQLAAAGAAGVLFAQGDRLTATRGYTMGVWTPSLSFSTDNRALALGSVGGTVRLFNRADGALLFQLVQPNLRVSQVRYRPGPPGVLAQYLASLGGDNVVYMWDVAYRKFLGTLNPGPSSAEALEMSGDGRWLAAASGNAVLVWDLSALPPAGWTTPPAPALTLSQEGVVTGLALSQDGAWLAASNAAGTIQLWTLVDGQPLGVFGRLTALPGRLAFSPDSQLVAAAYADQVIRVWGLGAAAGAPLAQLRGHTARITSLAFSPDGSVLASSSWDGTVREWAVGGGQ